MKHSYITLALAALALTACSSRQEAPTTGDEPEVTTEGPIEAAGNSYTQDVTVGGQNYAISIQCTPDHNTIIKDELDQEFYDNTVSITIRRDSTQIYSHTFTKAEFSGNYNASRSILQGMAYSSVSGGQFVFGAQVGDPGNDEGGTNFSVSIPTSGNGSATITPDNTQDTTSKE